MILYTSDIHCAVDQGFGLAGLQQIRDSLEAQGYETILVDDGDAIQGEAFGTLSKGEAMIDLMNAMHYDVAIPGNHEFDYGMDQFLALAEKAEFPYVSCNFEKEGERVFPSYVIKEAGGMKIAFVGVTTPETLTSSTPKNFQNEEGEFIYGFLRDETGEAVYQAVQQAVDEARAEGADYVYVLGHLGMIAASSPWTYADVIEHTNVELTINDAEAVDENGDPIRMIRRAETNLGDLGADAFRQQAGADIGLQNGGAYRASIGKGEITYGDIIKVFPFNNELCVIRVSGQQILDALEWGARDVPNEAGSFLQVSGLTYEIDVSVPSGCQKDENGLFAGVEGERRVRNVTVGGEPLEPDRLYTVAASDYMLLENGDGQTAFDGAELVQD